LPTTELKEELLPACLTLIAHHARQVIVQHEDRHQRVLVGPRAVHAPAVGEHGARRQPVEGHQVIDAGAMGMHPAQVWRFPRQILPVEAPAEQHMGAPHRLGIDVAVVADGDLHLALEARMAGQRRLDPRRRRLEHRTHVSAVLDMEVNGRHELRGFGAGSSATGGAFPLGGTADSFHD